MPRPAAPKKRAKAPAATLAKGNAPKRRKATIHLAPSPRPLTTPAHTTFIGLDPGAHGAVALIDAAGGLLALLDVPTDAHGMLDAHRLSIELKERIAGPSLAVLEEPTLQAPSKRTIAKQFAGYGAALAVLLSVCSDVVVVKPDAWKAHLSLTSDKSESKDRARTLYPSLPKVLRHDKAEALLLAVYARMKETSTLPSV